MEFSKKRPGTKIRLAVKHDCKIPINKYKMVGISSAVYCYGYGMLNSTEETSENITEDEIKSAGNSRHRRDIWMADNLVGYNLAFSYYR